MYKHTNYNQYLRFKPPKRPRKKQGAERPYHDISTLHQSLKSSIGVGPVPNQHFSSSRVDNTHRYHDMSHEISCDISRATKAPNWPQEINYLDLIYLNLKRIKRRFYTPDPRVGGLNLTSELIDNLKLDYKLKYRF